MKSRRLQLQLNLGFSNIYWKITEPKSVSGRRLTVTVYYDRSNRTFTCTLRWTLDIVPRNPWITRIVPRESLDWNVRRSSRDPTTFARTRCPRPTLRVRRDGGRRFLATFRVDRGLTLDGATVPWPRPRCRYARAHSATGKQLVRQRRAFKGGGDERGKWRD